MGVVPHLRSSYVSCAQMDKVNVQSVSRTGGLFRWSRDFHLLHLINSKSNPHQGCTACLRVSVCKYVCKLQHLSAFVCTQTYIVTIHQIRTIVVVLRSCELVSTEWLSFKHLNIGLGCILEYVCGRFQFFMCVFMSVCTANEWT